MKNALTYFLLLCCLATLSLAAKPIKLIWQVDRTLSWEEDWLKELLSGVNVEVVDDGKYQVFSDRSIIVVSTAANFKGCEAYFKKLHKLQKPFGVILLSDERYKVPNGFYKYPAFVFRNYWHKSVADQSNVTAFPLGYKTGFWKEASPPLKPADEREFTWSFAGQITKKPTREAMVAYLKIFPHFHIHETFAWADPNSLDVKSYRDLLLNSVFVPCPAGWWNLDSFRVYEALECGCIPIVEKSPLDYFSKFYGEHPFIAVSSWDAAPAQMSALLSDPALLEARRLECYNWWKLHKQSVHKQFVDTINVKFP